MVLTKPAVVGFQVIGGFLMALGIIVWSAAITLSPGSLMMIALGVFMFWAGGKAARRHQRIKNNTPL